MNKALMNAAASLLEIDSEPTHWNGSKTSDPDTFASIIATLPQYAQAVETLRNAAHVHVMASSSVPQVARWLDGMCKGFEGNFETKIRAAIQKLKLEQAERIGRLLAVGVYFYAKAPRNSWISHTDAKAVMPAKREGFIDIHSATPVKIVDGMVRGCYRVLLDGLDDTTSVAYEVAISTSAPPDLLLQQQQHEWPGFVLPKEISIDLDDDAFAPFLVGATTGKWNIIIAQCKGKFAITCECPLSAEVATMAVALTRGLGCMSKPQPNPNHFDFRKKPLKIELSCQNATLLELYYDNNQ